MSVGIACAAEPTPAQRGHDALTGRAFTPPIIPQRDYRALWRPWGLKERPADFDKQVLDRYGLHPPPYPNDDLPMGLRKAKGLIGVGITNDCLLCHGSSIFGKSIVGLPNSSIDLQLLFDELALVQGVKNSVPFPLTNVRGTTEATASAAYLLQFRNPDLTLREKVAVAFTHDGCEDPPAWWLLKRKQTMYASGSHPAENVRSMMSFLLTPLNGAQYIKEQEATFRDIHAYLLSIEAPKYPLSIEEKKAACGKELFEKNCSTCHGTYGAEGKYPNKIVALDRIGTDPTLARGYSEESRKAYNESWFGEETNSKGKRLTATHHEGYQAPPLDGVWATAPYFHNGSVPTIYHVLNSKARPKIFTRSYRTEKENYDSEKVGWKFATLEKAADPKLPAHERRKVYDTTQPGRSNAGHTFGDALTDDERMAIIEYLKTL